MQGGIAQQSLPGQDRTAPNLYLRERRLDRFLRRYGWKIGVVLELLGVLVAWDFFTTNVQLVSAKVLPPPSQVLQALAELVSVGTLAGHSFFTLQNFVIGFALAVVVAIPIGMIVGGSVLAEMLFAPPMWALYAVPRIALAPLFVLAFGLGAASKIAIAFSLASLPILINTMQGMKSVPADLVRAARVYGATRLEILRKIVLYSLLPYIFVGLRIGVAGAIAGALVGEMVGSFQGLGMLLARASYQFNIARALALVVVIVIMAQALMLLVQLAKRVLAPWDSHGWS